MESHQYRVLRKAFDALEPGELVAWQGIHETSEQSRWAFLSPAFSSAAHRSTGPVTLLLFFDGTELVAVLSLQRSRGWLGKLGLFEPVGRELADYFGLVAREGVQINLQQALKQARIPCLYFTHLDEQQQRYGLAGSSPRIGLRTFVHPDGGEKHWELLRVQDKKLVADTERRERKLEKEHGAIHFEMQSSDPERVLGELIRMKNEQYFRTGKLGAPLTDSDNVTLLRDLSRNSETSCMGRLSSISVNGELVAAHFGLQSSATLHFWFPVYNDRYSAYSPGRILFRRILLASQQEGINMIDRGEGDTPAKRDFANHSHQYFKGLATNGPLGFLVGGLLRLAWKRQMLFTS
ncbi:MAG: GNAT family N-acetyltransferase [Burkholderiales bacterium]|nr:MAG: GNAT family N-acetyltransferase [Burkholderiales bacterium]